MKNNPIGEVIVAVRALKNIRGVTPGDVRKFLNSRGLRLALHTVRRRLHEAAKLGFVQKNAERYSPLSLRGGPQILSYRRASRPRRGKSGKPKCPCFSKARRYRYRTWAAKNRYRRRRILSYGGERSYRRRRSHSRRWNLKRRQQALDVELMRTFETVGARCQGRSSRRGRRAGRLNISRHLRVKRNVGLGNRRRKLEQTIKVEEDPDDIPNDMEMETQSGENSANPNSETNNEDNGENGNTGQDENKDTYKEDEDDKHGSSAASGNTEDNNQKDSSHGEDNGERNDGSDEHIPDGCECEVENERNWSYYMYD